MILKAQSSVEYLAIVGLGLLMATPFIGLVQQDVISLRTDSQDARFVSSLDEMESAIERADALGDSAQTSFTLTIPDGIVDAKIVNKRNVVFTQNRSGQLTNYTRILETNLSDIKLPTERGRYRVTAKSSGNNVTLEYGTIIAGLKALDPLVVGNEVTFQDNSQAPGKSVNNREWIINGSLKQTGSETFSYTFSDNQVYNVTLVIESSDGEIDQVSKLYKPEKSETLAFSVDSQSEWNKGYFNLTSADRNDNSGNLGLGYLNGSNPSASSLEEGLVGYWRMDKAVNGDGGTVKDYSGEENNGSTNGGANTGVKGILGSGSINFGGGEYVDVQSDNTLEGMDNLAISAWIKPNSLGKDYVVVGGQNLYEIVLDDGSNRCNSGQNLWWAVENGDGDWTINCEDITIPTNSWTQVALVSDLSTDEIRIYKDGQLEVTNSGTGPVSSNGNPIGIAQRPDGFGSFDGKIDEARIYNRSLTSSNVEQLYFNGKPFRGNYISQVIDNSDAQDWQELEIEASVNSTADELTATFETLKSSLLYSGEQAYSSVEDWTQGGFNKTTADEIVTEYNYISELEASNQSGFNEGSFNGTSADRKDNSGDVGLGYRNGSAGDDLVGYWRFDSGSAKDYSGNGNDGTLNGSPTTGASGTLNTKAFQFDGNNDYVEVPDSPSLDITEGVTISMWLKGQPSGDWVRVLEKGENSAYELFGADGGSFQPWMRINGNDLHRGVGTVDGSNWVFLTGTYNASTGDSKIYINGSSVSTDSISTQTINTNSDTLRIATEESLGGSDKWEGSIDEVQVYNRSLSQTEIEHLYFNGRPFQGNYTAKKIDNSEETNWDKVKLNASVPSDTSVNATFKALDGSGSLVDSQVVDLSEGLHNYSLSVNNSEDAEVFINGTSSNVTKSWEISGLEVFSSEVEDKIEDLRIGYRNGSLGDDLVGYWRMDRNISGDGGTVVDYSGNKNEGLTKNGVSTGTMGVFESNSMYFSGNNENTNIKVNGSSELQFSGSFTLSAWVKPDTDNWGSWARIITGNGGNNQLNLGRDGSTNKPFVHEGSNVCSGGNFVDGEWTHIVGLYNGSQLEIYQDGERRNSCSTGGPSMGNSNYVIGARDTNGDGIADGEFWAGNIDEVQIYNYSLSQSEIDNLYFNSRPFKGNFTAEKIDKNSENSWEKVEINASAPSDTNLTAEFEALDSDNSLIDREYISVDSGSNIKNYSLNVQASEDARLSFNGTSGNFTKTWKVYDYEVFSGEREVGESEIFGVQDGFNEFSLGIDDSKDARIKLRGNTSNITRSWTVSNMSVFSN